jgi:hypothetical protein
MFRKPDYLGGQDKGARTGGNITQAKRKQRHELSEE